MRVAHARQGCGLFGLGKLLWKIVQTPILNLQRTILALRVPTSAWRLGGHREPSRCPQGRALNWLQPSNPLNPHEGSAQGGFYEQRLQNMRTQLIELGYEQLASTRMRAYLPKGYLEGMTAESSDNTSPAQSARLSFHKTHSEYSSGAGVNSKGTVPRAGLGPCGVAAMSELDVEI